MPKKVYPTQRPYIASYVIFRNNEGKIAFVLRSNTAWMNNHYGLPSGKVEENESFTECAMREAKEEVGAVLSLEDLQPMLTMHRLTKEGESDLQWIDQFFEAKQWKGELYNAEPKIHGELVWLDPDNLPSNMVPNVRAALEEIKRGKRYCEYK